MKLTTIEMRKLTASEGMVLTNGETFSSVGGDIYLGKNDSPDNWREITEIDFAEKMREKEERSLFENAIEVNKKP